MVRYGTIAAALILMMWCGVSEAGRTEPSTLAGITKLEPSSNTLAGPAVVEGRVGIPHTVFQDFSEGADYVGFAITVVNHGDGNIAVELLHNDDKPKRSDPILPGSSSSIYTNQHAAKFRVLIDNSKSGMSKFTWRVDAVPRSK